MLAKWGVVLAVPNLSKSDMLLSQVKSEGNVHNRLY